MESSSDMAKSLLRLSDGSDMVSILLFDRTVAIGALVALALLATYRKFESTIVFLCGLLRDVIRSRCGSLAYSILGRLWSRAHVEPCLSKVCLPRVGEVTVVRTAKHTGERLTVLPPLKMEAAPTTSAANPVVTLEPTVQYQTFLGFGGSFTETSADLFAKASAANQETIIRSYFSEDSGLNYRWGRLHMNSCDFSSGHWACAETEGDVKLQHFSIDRYRKTILPMVKRAIAAAGKLELMFSPWSPPKWMKDSGSMHSGTLLPEHRSSWADHYIRFAEEFAKEGVEFWGLTVQNEPDADTPWETCSYTAEEERDFVRDHLGPALEASKMDLKLLIWDHNRDNMFVRAQTIYADPKAAAYIWGVAYHWYGDPRYEFWPDQAGQVLFDNLQKVHDLRPDKHIAMTECCQEFGPRIGNWTLGERYAEAIIKDLNNWLDIWIDWNLILDHWGGPNHCLNRCSAPVIFDARCNRVLFLSSYYYIGHFSRYIKPGAKRIAVASNRDCLEVTAFANPDRTIAVVVLNQSRKSLDFSLRCGGSAAQAEAPAHSITTFLVGPSLFNSGDSG